MVKAVRINNGIELKSVGRMVDGVILFREKYGSHRSPDRVFFLTIGEGSKMVTNVGFKPGGVVPTHV